MGLHLWHRARDCSYARSISDQESSLGSVPIKRFREFRYAQQPASDGEVDEGVLMDPPIKSKWSISDQWFKHYTGNDGGRGGLA